MAFRAMASKSSLALVVISPPITTTLDFTKVSHATRLYLSPARHASRTASEIVSATLSGCPSPTDSEEKMYLSITLQKKARGVAGRLRLRQICRECPGTCGPSSRGNHRTDDPQVSFAAARSVNGDEPGRGGLASGWPPFARGSGGQAVKGV